MVFTINGTDIVPYIAQGGIKWQRNDIESPGAGRTMDGLLHRARVSSKVRLDISCRPLLASELQTVLNLIGTLTVTVIYDDPMYGRVTKTMYSNNNPASYLFIDEKGDETWTGITFPLIEI